jgi:hypothetical protein
MQCAATLFSIIFYIIQTYQRFPGPSFWIEFALGALFVIDYMLYFFIAPKKSLRPLSP